MNSPVADKICTGEFFYVTGNFVEFSDKVKSPPGRIALRRKGIMSLKRPAEDGESCRSRSLSCREQDKTGFNDLVCWTARVEKKDRKSGKKTWNCGEKSGRIRVVWKTFRTERMIKDVSELYF